MDTNPPEPSPGTTRAPFAATGKALARANEALETPLLKLLGKGVWLVVVGLVAVALYAGRAKLHEEIAQNPGVASAARRLGEMERATADNSSAVLRLKETDGQLVGIIDRVVTQQQTMTTQLAVVGEQIKQGSATTDKLQRSVERLAERLPARPGN